MLQIVWFKRDLRVHDHRPLFRAAGAGPVLPLYIVEPELWKLPDRSRRQWDFARESLLDLREALADLGQPLVVRVDAAVDVLDQLRSLYGVAALWSHMETGDDWTFQRDLAVTAWCRKHGIPWHEDRQHGIERGSSQRDGWAKRWDALMAEATVDPPALTPLSQIEIGLIPQAVDLGLADDGCVQRQAGGRVKALDSLESFLLARGEPYRTAMSSPVTGQEACSRLSPHLAWGTVAMREVSQATRRRQRDLRVQPKGSTGTWRSALSSFSGRLHWHCHFMQKLEDEPRLEFENLHPAYNGLRPSEPDRARLEAWGAGETGLPFVDACMRALTAWGWMNFRMRAMLMAVASYHLWLPWRQPGEHLARLFTDYEPGIHWPQVQMQSGTTGINAVRIYNPVKQGYDQDPKGEFVRRWVPELADVPDQWLHEPWRWDGAAALLGKRYPHPIVDYLSAAKEARQKIWAVRKSGSFREQAADIQQRHGSRKRPGNRRRT